MGGGESWGVGIYGDTESAAPMVRDYAAGYIYTPIEIPSDTRTIGRVEGGDPRKGVCVQTCLNICSSLRFIRAQFDRNWPETSPMYRRV